MEQKLPSRHTQSVQRTDDAALFFNIMYHKYGDHVSEHDHQDNTGYHTGIFIDDHIPAGGIDSGIIPCHQKLCQIVDIESKILIDHIIGFILQFLHTVPQFPAAIRNLIHGIRIIDDSFPEILQIRQSILRVLQGIPQPGIHTAALCHQLVQLFLIIVGSQFYLNITFFQLCLHHIHQCIHHGICAVYQRLTGGIKHAQTLEQLLGSSGCFSDTGGIGFHPIPKLCHGVQLTFHCRQLPRCLGCPHLCKDRCQLIQLLSVTASRQSRKADPVCRIRFQLCLELFIHHAQNGIKNSISSLIQRSTVFRDLTHTAHQCSAAGRSCINSVRVGFHTIPKLLQIFQRLFRVLQVLPQGCGVGMRISDHGIQLLFIIS